MNLETFKALNLYGVKITASMMLSPEFFAVDDWSNPSLYHHPEWLSVWVIGKENLIAHPTVLKKLSDEWEAVIRSTVEAGK